MHLDVIPDELRFITGDRTERLPMFSVEELGQAPAKKRAELVPTEEMQTWFNSQGTAASLERLHLSVMPVKQELFDAVCKLKTLTHLEIETFRCESLIANRAAGEFKFSMLKWHD